MLQKNQRDQLNEINEILDGYLKKGIVHKWQKDFIFRVKQELIKQGMKQKELAEYEAVEDAHIKEGVSIGASTLSDYLNIDKYDLGAEYDKKTKRTMKAPNVNNIFVISQKLGVSVPYLLGVEEATNKENTEICDLTGLNESSVMTLKKWNNEIKGSAVVDTINLLLSPQGEKLLYLLSAYLTSESLIDFDVEHISISKSGSLYGHNDKYTVTSEVTDFLLVNIMAEAKKLHQTTLDGKANDIGYEDYEQYLGALKTKAEEYSKAWVAKLEEGFEQDISQKTYESFSLPELSYEEMMEMFGDYPGRENK